MPQIICKNLCLGYGGNIIVNNLNFSVNTGDYLCVIGDNGSGKSTLIKTLLNLIKPVSGSIEFSENPIKKFLGYLPQQTEFQKDFPASVKEVVMSGCQSRSGFRPFYNKHEKKLAKDSMMKMKISELENKCYRELSGGQQQRVLLARALCAARKILILDEPVSGLDPQTALEMYEIISKLNRDEGITIIMVSHDIQAVLKYSSHILNLKHEENFFGTKEEFMKNHD